MNLIIGKRQIVLATLVLGLGIAIYLNWEFSNTEEPHKLVSSVHKLVSSVDLGSRHIVAEIVKRDYNQFKEEETENVAAISTKSNEYFAQARLNRQKSRDESIEALKKMLDESGSDKQSRDKLIEEASALSKTIESEGKIENIIKAKGFSEVMVYLQGEKVTVIIKTKGLKNSQVAQIKDVVITETDIDPEKISIVEVK